MERQGGTEGGRGARSAPCICRPPRSAGNPRPPLAHTQHTQLSAAAGSAVNEGRAAGPYSPACRTRGPPAPASGAPPWQLSAANDCRRATGEPSTSGRRCGVGLAPRAPRRGQRPSARHVCWLEAVCGAVTPTRARGSQQWHRLARTFPHSQSNSKNCTDRIAARVWSAQIDENGVYDPP